MLPFSTSQVFHPKFSKSKWIDKQVFKQKRKKGKKRFKKGGGKVGKGGGGRRDWNPVTNYGILI